MATLWLGASRPLLVTALHVVHEPERGPDEQQKGADEHDRSGGVERAVVNGDEHHQSTRRGRSEDKSLPHAPEHPAAG